MTIYLHKLGDPLSAKELDVLRSVSYGMSNRTIATRMCITEATVKNHVAAALRKLGADDRAHAVRLGFECGVLTADTAVAL